MTSDTKAGIFLDKTVEHNEFEYSITFKQQLCNSHNIGSYLKYKWESVDMLTP